MKFLRYFPLILTTAALLSLGSCKQDLGQDPPFDYPDEGSSGVQLPDPLYHLACDDDLFLDGTLAGEMKTFTGESPMFVDGKSGKAYQLSLIHIFSIAGVTCGVCACRRSSRCGAPTGS